MCCNIVCLKKYQMPLDWSCLCDEYPYCDVGLGSDIFYSPEDFDDIIAIIASLCIANPAMVFLTTYQMRRLAAEQSAA